VLYCCCDSPVGPGGLPGPRRLAINCVPGGKMAVFGLGGAGISLAAGAPSSIEEAGSRS